MGFLSSWSLQFSGETEEIEQQIMKKLYVVIHGMKERGRWSQESQCPGEGELGEGMVRDLYFELLTLNWDLDLKDKETRERDVQAIKTTNTKIIRKKVVCMLENLRKNLVWLVKRNEMEKGKKWAWWELWPWSTGLKDYPLFNFSDRK